jgi:pyruvate,orthophosphate dikinase
VKIAVDMAKEGLIAPEEAVLRVEPEHLDRLLHPGIDPSAKAEQVAKGLPASPGAAVGGVVFDADDAERLGKEGKKVILLRPETTPDDIHGIVTAQGVLTSRGGMTCHAAIVTRGMGKPCIVGCDALRVDVERKNAEIRGKVLREGDVITIDGSTGAVMLGAIPLVEPSLSGHAQEILAWADDFRRLGVRANADTPQNAAKARKFGAQGIGLCRTERMFNAQDRLPIVQEMILSESPEERRKALEKLLPMQRGDFKGILEAMDGLPVTIRLLDPPLHEFLPNIEEVLVEVAELRCKGGGRALAEKERLLAKIRALQEFNPMLGHRGCRLGLTFPDVYEMQVRAIFEAAIGLIKEGKNPVVEVMIPLVGHSNELKIIRARLEKVAKQVMEEKKTDVKYLFGTMIEIPRACMTAEEIAKHAEFFSFGTNDLTQATFGYSRDDAESKFLQAYLHDGILEANPFEVLDRKGVGSLMRIAVEAGRWERPDLKVGICGETGGEPSSIEFCHQIGLDYVSCSPFRVPIARLAAARAALRERGGRGSSTV